MSRIIFFAFGVALPLLVAASPWLYLLLYAGERFYAEQWTFQYFCVFIAGGFVSLAWWGLAWIGAIRLDNGEVD